MPYFFEPDIATTQALLANEAHHAVRVLRLRVGDAVQVLDGQGREYEATLLTTSDKSCSLRIEKITESPPESNSQFHLVVAPTKNLDRMEWMVEKCVEIGLAEISFVKCRYSERKELKLGRLHKIAVSAMKQSKNLFLPKLNPLEPLELVLPSISQPAKFIAHLEAGERNELSRSISNTIPSCVLIGPEGDFSTDEIKLARQHGFVPVSLGNSRLRTETAALVATTLGRMIS